MRGARKLVNSKFAMLARMPSVNLVDQSLAEFDESSRFAQSSAPVAPVGGVQIFAKVDAVRRNMRVEVLEGCDLLAGQMTSIIYKNVDARDFILEMLKKNAVALVADENFCVLGFEMFAIRIDVGSINSGVFTKIILPHL